MRSEMDPSMLRSNSKRSQESDSAAAQSLPEAGRTFNLSGRVSEYYDRLVNKNSLHSRNLSSNQGHPRTSIRSQPQQSFTERDDFHDNPVTLPMYRDASSTRSFNATSTYPYTLYVEDPTGAFQRLQKKKSPPASSSLPSTSSSHHTRSESPSNMKDASCTECSLSHSPRSCPLKSRIPPEQDIPVQEKSLSYQPSKLESSRTFEVNSSEDSSGGLGMISEPQPLGSQKGGTPNLSLAHERDVIGQERSPVSKSQPSTSLALSTSSSNGDSVPRERKKWVRPPLVGQAASSTDKPLLLTSAAFDYQEDGVMDAQAKERNLSSSTGSEQADTRPPPTLAQQQKSSYFDSSSDGAGGIPLSREEYFVSRDKTVGTVLSTHQQTSEGEQGLSDSCVGGRVSPSSSVTSSRRLEWDSGADVGYNQNFGSEGMDAETSGLCTIERMALAQGCSVALRLRLDPEGTGPVPVPIPPTPLQVKTIQQVIGKPAAESTPDERAVKLPSRLQHPKDVQKPGISPILNSEHQVNEVLNAPPSNLKGSTTENNSREKENPIQPVQKQWSNSLQDLRRFANKCSEGPLFKSQSDPDLAGDSLTVVPECTQSNRSRGISKGRRWLESNVAVHSISSGSDATLVHVETEEDQCIPDLRKKTDQPNLQEVLSQLSESHTYEENDQNQPCSSQDGNLQQGDAEGSVEATKSNIKINMKDSSVLLTQNDLKSREEGKSPSPPPHLVKSHSKKHVCSDTDHRRGLHHHFGVLCSTVIGGHIHSSAGPSPGPQTQNPVHLQERVYASVDEGADENLIRDESEPVTADSATSSALHSDAAHEESIACGNNLTGRANSFEYLPGHVYENNNAGPGSSRHEQPPGISTSTETDSDPVRPISRVVNHRVADSSSHDTEEDRLWGSPRTGSNTLVQDLERGLNLLKGVMANKSAGRRCKREVIRRVIRKLVTSDYVEDLMEKERNRHMPHSPFSPRRTKHSDWQERHLRPKRTLNNMERQEVSGESDEPKLRTDNHRKKGNSFQVPSASQIQKTHSILASGSKSSSLLSSQCDTTSGSISLSGSSDHHKTSKSSMKPNPLYKPPPVLETASDWKEPATHSEKIFELRKQNADVTKSSGAYETSKLHEDPVRGYFPVDPKQQLFWIKNEINQLKILKQLLQKKQPGEFNLDPSIFHSTLTAMPMAPLRQTMKMTDCTSSGVSEARSPKLSSQRTQQWAIVESDTSAFCALSNSSRDSQWQEIEVASAGERDGRPHRTVSLSEGEEDEAPTSNRKSEIPQSSLHQNAQKTRRRSVNISDGGQVIGTHRPSDVPVARSDRPSAGSAEGRTFSSKAAAIHATKPQERVYSSNAAPASFCRNCQHSAPTFSSSIDSRSSASRPEASEPARAHPCTCGPQEAVNTGAVRKSTPADKQSAPLPDSRPARFRDHVDQGGNSMANSVDSQAASFGRPVDGPEGPVMRTSSDDSVTKAVAEAVAAKVRALRNLGKIEEAEVKIRVKMGQLSDDVAAVHTAQADRVWKSQDLEEDRNSFVSKQTEMDEMIARQRALDQETRQKLLTIAESRQRAQPGASDTDHRIHELLLRDYLNRQQLKTSSGDTATQTRLNIRIDAPDILQKKTIGTSTARHTYENYSQTQEVLENSLGSNYTACSCGSAPGKRTGYARLSRPRTAPASCLCSCRSAPQRSYRTSRSSPDRELEFELQLTKQPARQFDAFNVHEALKDRNKAYFLRFEEDETVEAEKDEPPHEKPPLEVVTVRVPKKKTQDAQPSVSSSEVSPKSTTGKKASRITKEQLQNDRRNFIAKGKENVAHLHQPVSKRHDNLNAVPSNIFMKGDNGIRGFHSDSGTVSGSQDKNPTDLRRKNIASADSHREFGSHAGNATSEYVQGLSNVLRETPGRSHLSVTVTESSVDSVRSPDGDSGSSSSRLPSRKVSRSPHSPRRFASHYRRRETRTEAGSKRSSGKVFQTMAFGAGNNTSGGTLSSSVSGVSEHKPAQGDRQPVPDGGSVSDHAEDAKAKSLLSLQEYLEINYPEYLSAAEKRRRCIAEMAYLRRLRQQSRKRLLELEGDSLRAKQKQLRRARYISRPRPVLRKRTPPRNIRAASARKCLHLPEVQQRLAELKRKEENRTNRLMAEIYTRKLQEKVLKGSATIRSSVSVISSI